MGAAMAPAAYSTLSAHFKDWDSRPPITTWSSRATWARSAAAILIDFFRNDGLDCRTFITTAD
jgi:stage V sporulation protein AD